ncbi:protein Wfdc21-like [Petaurus breviceps papuanus]|uniref:protein Wfdc21-like n=1 Tax=Petaurus breviceps papuanus TaxID=3040969 RepID=UPI0036DB4CAB
MKLSSGLLFLLVLITFNMDQLEARVKENSLLGSCLELCDGDWDCEEHEECISNGCGHQCVDKIY